jgi:hypothetical protein
MLMLIPQMPVPLNTPTVFELSDSEKVTITLLDANHCLGAVMYAQLAAFWHVPTDCTGFSLKENEATFYTLGTFALSRRCLPLFA